MPRFHIDVRTSAVRDAETAKRVVEVAVLPKDATALAKYPLDMLTTIRVCEANEVPLHCSSFCCSSFFSLKVDVLPLFLGSQLEC